MAQFETLFLLVLLGVASMYFLLHMQVTGSGDPVNPQQTYQIAELNSTLNELNAALKTMLKETNLRAQQGERQQGEREHLRKAQPPPSRAAPPSSVTATGHLKKGGAVSTEGKKAVIFTMDSISSCNHFSVRLPRS